METEPVHSFCDRMHGQLDFEKTKKYAKMFVSNLNAYETGEPEKHAPLRPTEISDSQIQNIFFIGAGLCLVEEELKLKGRKRTRNTRQQAVEDLFSSLYSGAVPRLLDDQPKVKEMKRACFQSTELPEEASLQPGTSHLKNLLKDLEKNPVRNCVSRVHANKCKNALKKTLRYLQQRGVPKGLKTQLEDRIETEIKGLHFYMVYRDLWAAFSKSDELHESRKDFNDALDACEKAYAMMEEIFTVEISRTAALSSATEAGGRKRAKASSDQNTELHHLSSAEPDNLTPVGTQTKAEKGRDQSQRSGTNRIQVLPKTPEPPEQGQGESDHLPPLAKEESAVQTETDVISIEEMAERLNEAKKLQREEDEREMKASEDELRAKLTELATREKERHRIESNKLKTEVAAKAAELQQQKDKSFERNYKHLSV